MGKHVVVDGSNIATEGRAAPSLKQLDEAVRALIDELHYEVCTVVVDATFGHRIDASEREMYEEAVRAGELITPPAGAIGRGDAFVLQIADRAGADVFSNDSFQEFHGRYAWLFEEGRLVGGKPVASVGWVFVLRAPVRGPLSRRSVRDARKATKKASPAPETAPEPLPEVVAPTGSDGDGAEAASEPAKPASEGRRRRRRSGSRAGGGTSREPINDQLVYAAFVVDHPIGTVVDAVIDRFSSHGAYAKVGGAEGYVPLRALGDPPPRSAREVLTIGETKTFVVHRFDPERRGIDLVPIETVSGPTAPATAAAVDETPATPDAEEAPVPVAKKASAKKTAARKAPAKKTGARKTTARKAPARKTAAKKTAARKTTARKAPARKKAAAKKAPARKTAAKKTTARKAPARKKAAAKKAPARKTAAKKTTARKAPARKTAAKRTAAKKR